LNVLLETLENVTARHQKEFAATSTAIIEAITAVTDPNLAADEVAEIRRRTDIKIAEIESALAQAERATRHAEAEKTRALQDKAQADATAEQAIVELELLRSESEAARATQEETQRELKRALQQAQDQRQQAVLERDRADADTRITELRQELTETTRQVVTIGAEKAAAERLLADAHTTIDDWKARIKEQHAEHKVELATVREEARAERSLLHQEHASDVAALRAALNAVTNEQPATTPKK